MSKIILKLDLKAEESHKIMTNHEKDRIVF